MDTNSNIPAEKKVVSVEILHLDELGYGPTGEAYTARVAERSVLNILLDGEKMLSLKIGKIKYCEN